MLGLSALERSACRQNLAACRAWADEGGSFPTPSDSVSYEEIAALTDAVYGELMAMSANWDEPPVAVRADATATDIPKRASLVTPTPGNVLDLIAVLYDIGEIVVAGPNAERVRGLALDAAAMLVPGLPAPRVLAVAAKATRAQSRNLRALHAAAAVGRARHTALSNELRAMGHIGAARVTLVNGGIGYIDGAIIDHQNKIITIIELKPASNIDAVAQGLRQLVDYKSALQSMERWVTNGHNLPLREMLSDGWSIATDLRKY